MKIIKWIVLLYCLTNTQAQLIFRGKVKKRNTPVQIKTVRDNRPECLSNETISNDYEILSSLVSESKYIFTGKVLNVRTVKKGDKSNRKVFHLYKVYIRQVLKGDINHLRDYVQFGNSVTLNGAIVFVEVSKQKRCGSRFHRHSSAIFLSEDLYNRGDYLRLLKEPLPLTLLDLINVDSALKGKIAELYL